MREAWRTELAQAYTSAAALAEAGLISQATARAAGAVGAAYQVSVTRPYAALFGRDPERPCPIRAQAVPDPREGAAPLPVWAQAWSMRCFGRPHPETADAIGDLARLAAPRVTHRYRHRAILHVSPACAVYCRFCFRKAHLAAAEADLYGGPLSGPLAYLAAHPEVREVILTGGDPLSLPDAALARLLAGLADIPHLRHVRIHSRMPVTLPARLTPALARLLGGAALPVSLASHFNHPRELTAAARRGLTRLRRRGVALLNQTVLLAGVNDRAATLGALWQRLHEQGVRPFYLHHPDYTPGTFHFRVGIARGLRLMARLAGRLSGPALPAYVLDLPGGLGKVRLAEATTSPLLCRRGGGIAGALYRFAPPATRAAPTEPVLYPDLWVEGGP